jgi:pyrophosphatase PpaX
MSSPRLPAVLFDLDGTLIDSVDLIVQSARHAFAVCPEYGGRVPTDEEWVADLGMPLTVMFRRFTDDEAEVEELIAGYREYQVANHDALVRCYDGVAATLRELSSLDHPIGIVTSKVEAMAERGLAVAGLDGLVDTIVGLESTRRHKPDPEPVRTALGRLGLRPADACFVGDSPHDMTAGRAAGVVTIGALWGPFTKEQLQAARADYLARSPREVLRIVERLAEEREEMGEDDET